MGCFESSEKREDKNEPVKENNQPEKKNSHPEEKNIQPEPTMDWVKIFAATPEPPADGATSWGYTAEHGKIWNAYTSKDWTAVAALAPSQTSTLCRTTMNQDGNFKTSIRVSTVAVAALGGSADDIALVLRRGCEALSCDVTAAVDFLGGEVEESLRKATIEQLFFPCGASAPEAPEILTKMMGENPAPFKYCSGLVLEVTWQCIARESPAETILGYLEPYLKAVKPGHPYDCGNLLAIYYAMRWRQSGRKHANPPVVPVFVSKKAYCKVKVKEEEVIDLGVTEWDDDELNKIHIPNALREWKLFSDGMSYLTNGAIAFEPMLCRDYEDRMVEANPPILAPTEAGEVRCIAQLSTGGAPSKMILDWEACHPDLNAVGFHFLWPGATGKMTSIPVVNGGIPSSTLACGVFKGRPAWLDEGPVLGEHIPNHHRLFWLFHETHHKYEVELQETVDFAKLIKTRGHPMFDRSLWIEEFKGGNEEFFPNAEWKGDNEFDWYVQCITRRCTALTDPSFADRWLGWWGGKAKEASLGYHDFGTQHGAMWVAFTAGDWVKVNSVSEDQLSEGCHQWSAANYPNSVKAVVHARAELGLPIAGPVVDALRQGLSTLGWEKSRAGELVRQGVAWRDELIALV